MQYRFLADLVVLAHFLFIAFVAVGGLLLIRWPRLAVVHLPAVVWAAYVELSGTICPLTPLEHRLRLAAGERGYTGDFIDHYLLPVIYPAGLTADMQQTIGLVLILLNVAMYFTVWRRLRVRRELATSPRHG